MPTATIRVGRGLRSDHPRIRRVFDFLHSLVAPNGDFLLGDVTIGRGGSSVYTNAAFGRNALRLNTTGTNNSAGGNEAMLMNETGTGNTAFGNSALASNVSGGLNTVFGNEAMASDTSTFYCTAIGYQALYTQDNASGHNTAVGLQALYSNTQGFNNCAFGGSMYYNTIGNYNSAYGDLSLFENTTGSKNCAFGYQAGRYHADGVTALTDAENSIYIGADCRGFNNSDSNSIVIGYASIGEGANTTVIGNSSTTTCHLHGDLVTEDIEPETDDTHYLGRNDDDSPKAWKGVILRDQATGTYYRLQIDSGAVVLIDLTD